MASAVNGSFASPMADGTLPNTFSGDTGLLSSLYSGVNGYSLALSILLVLIAYDQCASSNASPSEHVMLNICL